MDVINQHTGESWYYSDIVKDHFFHPRNLLLEKPADAGVFDAHGMVGSPACILPSTLIQTNPHAETIDQTTLSKRVLSHDGLFHQIKRIFKPKYITELVKIRNPLGEIVATKDHLIYAIQVQRSKSWFMHTKRKKELVPSWVHAGDLKRWDITLYPIPKIEKTQQYLLIPPFHKNAFDFRSKKLPRRIPLNGRVLELFGFFVAEGHTKQDGKEVGFTFGIEEMEYAERVAQCLKKYFGLTSDIKRLPKNNRINVVVYSVELAHVFKTWFGNNAATKQVPEFILFLPPTAQQAFLRGVWLGDGYFSARRAQPRAGFATISKTLIHQMKWLLLRQRILPSVYQELPKKRKGVSHQASFRLHVGDRDGLSHLAKILHISFVPSASKRHAQEIWHDNQYFYIPVRAVGATSFHGRLYNLEVEKTHTYTTDAFLVHNCGDMMEMWMTVDADGEKIKDLKWKTFGCASAIAATSMFSVMLTENGGLTLASALKVRPQDVMMRLGGLPNRKIHCSVLADKAFAKTANDYFRKTGQNARIVVEGARVIDTALNITDKDIEEAVLEGAQTLEEVQKKLKVGVGSPELITEIEQLIRFYKEKYYG